MLESLTVACLPLPAFPRRFVPHHCDREGCTAPIIDRLKNDRHPFHCANKDKVHEIFVSPQPVAVAVMLFGRQIPLVKRGRDPGMLLWSAPSGFVEWGDTTQETALKEFGQEVFGLPADRKLGIDLDWRYIGESPGTEERAMLIFWGGRWPVDVPIPSFPQPIEHDASIPNYRRPEVLEVGLFEIDKLPPLAFPQQREFFEKTLAHFWG